MWGSFFFGFFLLAKQKKETRLKAKKNIQLDLRCANTNQFTHPTHLNDELDYFLDVGSTCSLISLLGGGVGLGGGTGCW